MAWVRRLDRELARVERAIIVLLLVSLLGLGLLQVLLRNLFSSGLVWADSLLRHQVLWLGMLSAALATHERQHLRLDVLSRLLPDGWRPWIEGLTDLVAMAVCARLTQAAWTLVEVEHTAGTRVAFGVAVWLAQSLIPLGFLLMTVHFALHLVVRLGPSGRQGSSS